MATGSSLKAIETVYNGYRFRSRLEARWAVFFDFLGVEYEYEKEGFDLDGLKYLPDFWFPTEECWAEIKPDTASEEEVMKASRLVEVSKQIVFLIECSPPDSFRGFKGRQVYPLRTGGVGIFQVSWGVCHVCRKFRMTSSCDCRIKADEVLDQMRAIGTEAIDLAFGEGFHGALYELHMQRWQDGIFEHPLLMEAFLTARQARFEFGDLIVKPGRPPSIQLPEPQRPVSVPLGVSHLVDQTRVFDYKPKKTYPLPRGVIDLSPY